MLNRILQGDNLDHDKLGQLFGVPMIPTSFKTGMGVELLFHIIINMYEGEFRKVWLGLAPFDIAVDGGEKIVFAVVEVNLGSPDGTCEHIVVGNCAYLHRAFPVLEVLALICGHSASRLSIAVVDCRRAVHVVNSFVGDGEDIWIANVDVFKVYCACYKA